MVVDQISNALQKRRKELVDMLENNRESLDLEKQHQVYGAINELDLFLLTEKGVSICIECKTGEFRHDIDKYLSLRKQLNIEKKYFVICVFGLSQEQTQGMTSMYELTFVNENNLIDHIQTVI